MNQKQMKEFIKALNSIAEEKKVDKKIVIEAMEQAMSAAYKKEGVQNVQTKVDPETGDIRNYSYRTV
jgi:N utilization substance protein A